MKGRLRAVCAALGLALLLAATAGGVRAETLSGRETSAVILSNERTFTRWAHVARVQPVFREPSATSLRVARLHRHTEDGFPEVYLLLRALPDALGQTWVELRIPGRPNGRVGWVRREALGAFHVTHRLVVVERGRLRLSVYSFGRRLWSAPVGIGAARSPTPAGHFWIREEFRVHNPSSGYYPFAFGTADYSHLTDWPGGGVVGIHGPFFAPSSIPGRISHGCIRLEVSADRRLAEYVRPGTPVLVR
jgi:hypothetical protein